MQPSSSNLLAGESETKITVAADAVATVGLQLHFFWDGGSTAVNISAEAVIVGRAANCDVRIPHDSVSRRHAIVHGGLIPRIEDLGSANGTWVGNTRVAKGQSVALRPGVVASIGSVMVVLRSSHDHDWRTAIPTARHAEKPTEIDAPPGVVIADPSMLRLYRLVDMVAESTIGVILLGETGAGKEVVAETIHRRSARAAKPFLRLNCAALPDALLESELFGHERGAFTGAIQAKPGLLETAEGGTVFLDEIGELPLATQAKLLHALENREVMRLGGLKPLPIDVRFVAATHRDLEALVESGRFRQDLYFRMNGISFVIPPLRERAAELEPLARAFAAKACRDVARPPLGLSGGALAVLRSHSWPGNVRELRNVIERAVLLCSANVLGPEDIVLRAVTDIAKANEAPGAGTPMSAGSTLTSELAALERARIIDALEKCNGSQTDAAKSLGISRRTLLYRLDVHGLPRPRKRATKQ